MPTTLILVPPHPNSQTFLRPLSTAELAFTFAIVAAAAFTTEKWLGRGVAGLTQDLSRLKRKT